MGEAPAPSTKEPEPYYPSLSVPGDVFGTNGPKVGGKITLSIECEVEEVRKEKGRGISCRVKVLSGCLEGKLSSKDFEKMKSEEQDEEIEKEMNKNKGDADEDEDY